MTLTAKSSSNALSSASVGVSRDPRSVVEHAGVANEGVEPTEHVQGVGDGALVVGGDGHITDDPGEAPP